MKTNKGVFTAIKEMEPVNLIDDNDPFFKQLFAPPKIGTKAYNMQTLEVYEWNGKEWILDDNNNPKPKKGDEKMIQLTETIRVEDLIYRITPEVKVELLRMLTPYAETAKLAPTPPVVVATTDKKPEGEAAGAPLNKLTSVESNPEGKGTATENLERSKVEETDDPDAEPPIQPSTESPGE